MTEPAQIEFHDLPRTIQQRVMGITARLAMWPAVSGAKPLRGGLNGSFRIRTGDCRVVFTVSLDGETVTITKIGNRGGVYD